MKMNSSHLLKVLFCSAAVMMTAGTALGDTLALTGTLRDFKRGDKAGGHPDFETCNTVAGHGKYGLVNGLVSMVLSESRRPVYSPTRPSNDSISSSSSFASWFTDTPGVNLSFSHTITLSNGQSLPGGIYSYSNNKFFPLDGKGYGHEECKDASGVKHNYGFTFELRNSFTYRPGQQFTFNGDDDVWSYINGYKVIDLGGVHGVQSGSVLLFDGKAFVNKNHFAVGGLVQTVSSTQAATLASNWTTLGMSGSCPITSGSYYVDLGIGGSAADVMCTFTSTVATVKSGLPLSSVVLKFTDNTVQKFDDLTGKTGSFSGTGGYAGRQVAGVWVKKAGDVSGGYGSYYGADGSGGIECTLDFFFAERHVTESNFRIDTSMQLKPKANIGTISPLYD